MLIIAAFKVIISGSPFPLKYIKKYNYRTYVSQNLGMVSDIDPFGVCVVGR